MGSSGAGAVVSELQQWRSKFEAGRLRLWGIRQAKLHPGERLAVRFAAAQFSDEDPSLPMAEWETVPGPAFSMHAPPNAGMAIATSERAFIYAGGKRGVIGEWRWADVTAVNLLRPPVGVSLASSPNAARVTVLSSRWNKLAAGSTPQPLSLMVRWLKFEAAFQASRGTLDEWMAALPARVAAGVGGRA